MRRPRRACTNHVSVLFNEPKLLKCVRNKVKLPVAISFSALQRAEIAEIAGRFASLVLCQCFSALQRAEIAEIAVPLLMI